jgi:hypothetical protein
MGRTQKASVSSYLSKSWVFTFVARGQGPKKRVRETEIYLLQTSAKYEYSLLLLPSFMNDVNELCCGIYQIVCGM